MKPFCNILYLFGFNQDCGLFVTTPPYPIKTISHNSEGVPVSAECKQMAKDSEVRIRTRNPLFNLKSPRPGTAYHCRSYLLLELAHDSSWAWLCSSIVSSNQRSVVSNGHKGPICEKRPSFSPSSPRRHVWSFSRLFSSKGLSWPTTSSICK